ncbi:MAG: hypothetical protein H0U75_06585 [Legionella sp.]|nr:hypothetical protein [Legionella sp.]
MTISEENPEDSVGSISPVFVTMIEEEQAPKNLKLIVSTNNIPMIILVSIVNGIFYYAIALEGGKNIQTLFDINGKSAGVAINAISVGACLVYTMFSYKTYEFLSLRINSMPKAFFSVLALFAASAFLTAGYNGALLLGFNDKSALAIGIILFALRMVNCVDASVKFPGRFLETVGAWRGTSAGSIYAEKLRLSLIWIASILYVLCTTDSIYNTSEVICGWVGLNSNESEAINYTACILGAVGTLPLNVYWGYRGFRQLTFGGKKNAEGVNPDPTDIYTFLGLILVTPVMLGILGGATASTGKVFGQIGPASQDIRIISSIFYAVCAGTPGMATLLRNIALYIKNSKEEKNDFLLLNEPESIEDESSKFRKSMRCCIWSKEPNKQVNVKTSSFSPDM